MREKSQDGAWFSDLVIWMGGSVIHEGRERRGEIIFFRGKITNMLSFSGWLHVLDSPFHVSGFILHEKSPQTLRKFYVIFVLL